MLKDHILKFLRSAVLLKECPVEIQTSVFQMRTPLPFLTVNYVIC